MCRIFIPSDELPPLPEMVGCTYIENHLIWQAKKRFISEQPGEIDKLKVRLF